MKKLVAFYSRTGTTKHVAHELAVALKADIEEIKDTRNRSGLFGWLRSGYEATKGKAAKIQSIEHNPSNYGLTVVGTPVWAGSLSSPSRAYLAQNARRFKRVAFFCVQGGKDPEKAFRQMQEACGKEPVATLALTRGDVVAGEHTAQIKHFARELKRAVA